MPKKRKTAPKTPVRIAPKFSPESVRHWSENLVKYKKKSVKARDDARRHMSAVGWKFWRARLKSGKLGDLRYESPAGKIYYLLRAACQACVESELAGFESIDSNSPPQEAMPVTIEAAVPRKRGRLKKNGVAKTKETREIGADESMSVAEIVESSLAKKRGRKRKVELVEVEKKPRKPGKVVAKLKRLRSDNHHPKLQIRSPRTVLSSLIDNKIVAMNAKVHYRARMIGDRALATGRVTREGVVCDCCGEVFALTAFEGHAGSTKHRPGANIILDEDGRSISDCQQELKRLKDEKKVNSSKQSGDKFDKIDDLCSLCHIEGELILCDGCPAAFHKSCLGLSEVVDGVWFCPACSCGICGSGKHEGECVPGEIRKCDQCEHKFHVECLRDKEVAFDENWFCSRKCQDIMKGLKELLGKPIVVGDNNLTWTMFKASSTTKINSRATHKKLRVALNVLHKCFEPCVDPYTQRDLVEDIVLNRESNLRRLNFRGFYTVILERKKEALCVATVRVYGKVAEVPLVATMFQHRRLGMCRLLMKELEKQLANLGVKRLVLPSYPAALDTWTNTSIGFSEMPEAEKPQFVNYFFLYFTGTILCHKILKQRSAAATEASKPVENVELDDNEASGSISALTDTENGYHNL